MRSTRSTGQSVRAARRPRPQCSSSDQQTRGDELAGNTPPEHVVLDGLPRARRGAGRQRHSRLLGRCVICEGYCGSRMLPVRLGYLQSARALQVFFTWYNDEHRHNVHRGVHACRCKFGNCSTYPRAAPTGGARCVRPPSRTLRARPTNVARAARRSVDQSVV